MRVACLCGAELRISEASSGMTMLIEPHECKGFSWTADPTVRSSADRSSTPLVADELEGVRHYQGLSCSLPGREVRSVTSNRGKRPVAIIVWYGHGFPPLIVWEWMDV